MEQIGYGMSTVGFSNTLGIIDTAASKRFIRGLLWRLGIDVRWASQVKEVMDFVNDRRIDIVMDVGANIGQFGLSLRAKGYRGKIVSFEPVKSAFQALAERAKADGNWEVHNLALGAAPGETMINVSDLAIFSSILPLTDAATEFNGRARYTHTETIAVQTLDHFADVCSNRTLLKIDTQGYERQVLEGARETLPRLKGVLMELPVIHLYQGAWQFQEALEFMARAGYVPAQIHPVVYDSKDKVSLVEVDCLFRPC